MHSRIRSLLPSLWIVGAIILTAIVYYPGLSGGWLLDDKPNIVENNTLKLPPSPDAIWTVAIADNAGPLRRPVSMLSFYANYQAGAELDPRPYKITNLAIHLLNGLAAFWFLLELFTGFAKQRHEFDPLRVQWTAALGATLWMLHPLGLTNVLYIVQRMNALSGGFTLLAVAAYLHGRNRLEAQQRGWGWIGASLLVFTPLAALSKENGALAPLLMWVAEYFIFQFQSASPVTATRLKRLFTATLLVPATVAAFFIASHPQWLFAPYQFRNFDLYQRLLTESRVVWRYIGWILAPTPSRLGLAHGDIPISHSLLQPLTTIPAIAGWVAAIALAFRLRTRVPLIGFAIIWFLAGQILESTIFGLEIAFEHRTYVPMIGLLAMLAYALNGTPTRQFLIARRVLLLGLIAVFTFCTAVTASEWSDNRIMALYQVQHHPNAPRANSQAAAVFASLMTQPGADKDYDYDQATYYFKRTAELDPTDPTSVLSLVLLRGQIGAKFDPEFVDWVKQRLRHRPIHPRIIYGFASIVHWIKDGQATVPSKILIDLFETALTNTTIPTHYRAALYSLMSQYYANTLNDWQTAIQLSAAAISEDPDAAVFHISMARLALALNRLDITKSEVATARRLDHLGRYHAQIENILKKVHDLELNPSGTPKDRPPKGKLPAITNDS